MLITTHYITPPLGGEGIIRSLGGVEVGVDMLSAFTA